MAEHVVCPHCGTTLRIGEPATIRRAASPDVPAANAAPHPGEGPEALLPESRLDLPVLRLDPSSSHSADAFVAIHTQAPPNVPTRDPAAHDAASALQGDEYFPGSDELTAAELDMYGSPGDSALVQGPLSLDTRSSEHMIAIPTVEDTSFRSTIPDALARRRAPGRSGAASTSWTTVILAAYAGILTLLLAWLFFSGRVLGRRQAVRPSPPPSAGRSVEPAVETPLAAIPPARTTHIGTPLRVGEIEVTPIEIKAKRVSLRNVVDPDEWRSERGKALWLKLRIRNLSPTSRLTPVEPRFVRQPDRGMPESLIDTAAAPILPFPLAVASEWEIVGQTFPELAPGAAKDVVVVSEAADHDRLVPNMTWRIKVRTGVDRTEEIAVKFGPDELK